MCPSWGEQILRTLKAGTHYIAPSKSTRGNVKLTLIFPKFLKYVFLYSDSVTENDTVQYSESNLFIMITVNKFIYKYS